MPLPRALSLSRFTAPLQPPRRNPATLHARRRPVDARAVDAGFGLPSAADPDPFGVLALERAGLAITEAGSRHRASSDAFAYRPAPTSPVFRLSLQSHDGGGSDGARASPVMGSRWSMRSMDQGTQTADLPAPVEEEGDGIALDPPIGSQDSILAAPAPAYHSPIREPQGESPRRAFFGGDLVASPTAAQADEAAPQSTLPSLAPAGEPEVPIAVVAEAVQGPMVAKAKLVNIRGRPAPALPSRNPMRAVVRAPAAEVVEDADVSDDDASSAYSVSPTRSGFDDDNSPKPWSAQTSVGDADSLRRKSASSRPASLDVRSDGDYPRSRQGSQDVGSPLSREVGNELPPRRNLSGSTLDQQDEPTTATTMGSGIAHAAAVKIAHAVDSTEAWREEDEFHSVPASPALNPLRVP